VLVVDDEPSMRFALEEILAERGFQVIACARADLALERLNDGFVRGRGASPGLADVDVVLTDLAMPGMSGLELVRAVRVRRPGVPVVVLTARGSERTAVEVIKAGALDYLSKPFDLDELVVTLQRAAEMHRLKERELDHAAEQAIGRPIVGDSAPMRRLLNRAGQVASRDVTVLVHGESGTGKELIAAFIHARSPRNGRAFVRFNVAALPASLAEAELFGHARGAFTGATSSRPGFVRNADGGTLVLDEVAELALELQVKLLRVLQEGEVQPLGTSRVEKVDVRVIACTNRNLKQEVAEGRFREDLYYRLAVVELDVPPLSARRDDIPALARLLAARYAERFGMENIALSADLLGRLAAREWPGNVRELENCVARMLAFSSTGQLGVEDLEEPSAPRELPRGSFRTQVAEFERQLIERALKDAQGNQSEAARRLDLTRATLIDKMKRYGLHPRTGTKLDLP
jgi:two-component system response regulator AtoC